eukprot:3846766-Alexandrium_andersonii.AAC.1
MHTRRVAWAMAVLSGTCHPPRRALRSPQEGTSCYQKALKALVDKAQAEDKGADSEDDDGKGKKKEKKHKKKKDKGT